MRAVIVSLLLLSFLGFSGVAEAQTVGQTEPGYFADMVEFLTPEEVEALTGSIVENFDDRNVELSRYVAELLRHHYENRRQVRNTRKFFGASNNTVSVTLTPTDMDGEERKDTADALNPETGEERLAELAGHDSWRIRFLVAVHDNATANILEPLLTDDRDEVKDAARNHPTVSEERRTALENDELREENEDLRRRIAELLERRPPVREGTVVPPIYRVPPGGRLLPPCYTWCKEGEMCPAVCRPTPEPPELDIRDLPDIRIPLPDIRDLPDIRIPLPDIRDLPDIRVR